MAERRIFSVNPTERALTEILGARTDVICRVDIYEEDASTLWRSINDLRIKEGSVSVDQTRDERRAFELLLDNSENDIHHLSDELWYDKVIKIYRGVRWLELPDTVIWETILGTFNIDQITTQNFPHDIHIQGRDNTKKLLESRFKVPTQYPPQSTEQLIRTIAIQGGISPNRITWGLPTPRTEFNPWTFDKGTSRWEAIKMIAESNRVDAYFKPWGYLTVELFSDPFLSPARYRFQTGLEGNLVKFSKICNDSRLYNSVVVVRESPDNAPIYAFAENHIPGSSTAIEEIGERVLVYSSIGDPVQSEAQDLANDLLSVSQLEEYNVNMESICIFWLEAGNVIEFFDPNAQINEPNKFLFSNFTIPLKAEAMSSVAKRIVRVL